MYMEYTKTLITLFTIIVLPYFIDIPPQPWIVRLYIRWGSQWFDGGTSLSMENELPKHCPGDDKAIFAGCHPHGMLYVMSDLLSMLFDLNLLHRDLTNYISQNGVLLHCISTNSGAFCMGYLFAAGLRIRAIEDLTDDAERAEFVGVAHTEKYHIARAAKFGLVIGYLVNSPIFNFFITKLTGGVQSASKHHMRHLMEKQISFGLLPGGIEEATLLRHGENAIFIRNRKGFIKYCLQYGYEIWPIYTFGECETYRNLFYTSNNSMVKKLKQWFNQKKIAILFPVGPYWWSIFLPYSNTGIHSILGNSRCEKIENPTQEQIDEVHQWYIEEIVGIFNRNKWRFGYADDVQLKVV